MNFTLDDISQEKSALCEVEITSDDWKTSLKTMMNIASIVSECGSKAQAAHTEVMADIMPITASNIHKYQEANIVYSLAVCVGWPSSSDEFFLGAYSADYLEEVLRNPSYYPVVAAIREASTVSTNFISTDLLKPIPTS